MRLCEQLDHQRYSQHRPCGFRKHRRGHRVRLRQEVVSRWHFRRDHALDAAEQLLMLEFFITEANQRLQSDLVTGPVKFAQLKNLAVDETFHQAEDVRIGPSLNLTEENGFVLAQKLKLTDAGNGVRQELMRRIELAAS